MPTHSLHNWLNSKFPLFHDTDADTNWNRQNPVVLSAADKVFGYIVQALEAETLQGQTAARVATSAKKLVAATGLNADHILSGVNPDNQAAVRSYFQWIGMMRKRNGK